MDDAPPKLSNLISKIETVFLAQNDFGRNVLWRAKHLLVFELFAVFVD